MAEFYAAAAAYVERNGKYPEVFSEGFVFKRFLNMQYRKFKMQRETNLKSMYAWELDNVDEDVKSFIRKIRIAKFAP